METQRATMQSKRTDESEKREGLHSCVAGAGRRRLSADRDPLSSPDGAALSAALNGMSEKIFTNGRIKNSGSSFGRSTAKKLAVFEAFWRITFRLHCIYDFKSRN